MISSPRISNFWQGLVFVPFCSKSSAQRYIFPNYVVLFNFQSFFIGLRSFSLRRFLNFLFSNISHLLLPEIIISSSLFLVFLLFVYNHQFVDQDLWFFPLHQLFCFIGYVFFLYSFLICSYRKFTRQWSFAQYSERPLRSVQLCSYVLLGVFPHNSYLGLFISLWDGS